MCVFIRRTGNQVEQKICATKSAFQFHVSLFRFCVLAQAQTQTQSRPQLVHLTRCNWRRPVSPSAGQQTRVGLTQTSLLGSELAEGLPAIYLAGNQSFGDTELWQNRGIQRASPTDSQRKRFARASHLIGSRARGGPF